MVLLCLLLLYRAQEQRVFSVPLFHNALRTCLLEFYSALVPVPAGPRSSTPRSPAGRAAMPLIYSFVAKAGGGGEPIVLADYTAYTGNFGVVAIQARAPLTG
jgi:hypothetical protein